MLQMAKWPWRLLSRIFQRTCRRAGLVLSCVLSASICSLQLHRMAVIFLALIPAAAESVASPAQFYIYNKLRLFCPRPDEASITLLVVDCGWCRIDIYLVSPYYLLSQTHTEHNQCSSLDRELLTNTNFQLFGDNPITHLVTLSRCHTCHDECDSR